MASDPYKYFRVEARELLDGLSAGAMKLEKGEGGPAEVARLLRLAHTLKGAARVVRQAAIAELAHAAEEVLAPFRESGRVPPEAAARLLRTVDDMNAALAGLDARPGEAPIVARPHATVVPSLAAAPAPVPLVDERFETVRVPVAELDALIVSAADARVGLGRIAHHARALEDVVRAAAPATGVASRELLETLARIQRELGESVERSERRAEDIRIAADRLRLVPVATIFGTLERAVHDAAAHSGKRALLVTSGGENRFDAHVLASLRDALLHIVRNAVAHGIESSGERRAASKPETGRIVVAVERTGGRARVTCADDGRGIDVEGIARIARERGLLAPDAGALEPDVAIALLLRGGISTAGAVNEVAGRGVGLDVVREMIARLKGSVRVTTAPGRGATFDLEVPISISSHRALVVEAGAVSCSIALDDVVAAVRLADSDIVRLEGREAIIHEGASIPFAPLVELLGAADGGEARRAWSALVVKDAGGPIAIGADRLLGAASVVVRALPKAIGLQPVLSGASLDELGAPRLALDARGLALAVRERTAPAGTAAAAGRLPVLVIDDSLTTRMLEQSILESAGYEVDVATSAEEGLEKARARRYGVFVVDVEMPGMSGYEFVALTRRDPTLSATAAILVTSRGSPEDRRRGLEAGAHAYIVKGEFDQRRLLAAIREVMG